jgi:hypothetical protein
VVPLVLVWNMLETKAGVGCGRLRQAGSCLPQCCRNPRKQYQTAFIHAMCRCLTALRAWLCPHFVAPLPAFVLPVQVPIAKRLRLPHDAETRKFVHRELQVSQQHSVGTLTFPLSTDLWYGWKPALRTQAHDTGGLQCTNRLAVYAGTGAFLHAGTGAFLGFFIDTKGDAPTTNWPHTTQSSHPDCQGPRWGQQAMPHR